MAEQILERKRAAFSTESQRLDRFKKIGATLTVDVVAGMATGLLVAPVVAIIDKSIITNASGKEPLAQGLKNGFHLLFTNPFQFARQPYFFPVFCIFAGTYTVANSVETISNNASTTSAVSSTLPKFLASSGINITLCAWKDSLFTQWYGVVKPKPIPTLSLALFGLRDSMTVGTSFLAPPIASKFLQSEYKVSKASADFVTQMTLPCLVQFVSTPVHLVSLDLYNHPGVSAKEHWKMVKTNYWKTAVGRVFRTVPGFGVGGVANRQLRVEMNHWMQK
ncbi:hypothetical protein BDR26DRAFT_869550 [Obelidium mucronatum]|nr:hypothetical protein BDR26DRAFT_869550 [Obelidium mucronatum]